MVITYFGKQFFKLQVGDVVVALNPISKESKLKGARFGADIALITVNHPDYNGAEMLSFGEKIPFIARGPGEYEVKGIFIKGIPSEGKLGLNTIYVFTIDKIKVCFLGALSGKLSAEAREAIDEADILFTPIGGEGVLTPEEAYSAAVLLEPALIIPMDYEGKEAALKKFLKEGGAEKIKPEEKLTLKIKDLEGKDGEIAVLTPSS